MYRTSVLKELRLVPVISLSVLLAWVGVGVPSAGARKLPFKILTYNVVYKGSGTYSHDDESYAPAYTKTSARFNWAVHYHMVIFDHPGEQATAITGPLSVGSGTWTISADNGGGDTCTKSGGLELNTEGGIMGRVQPSGKIPLQLTPGSHDYTTTGGSSGSGPCDVADYWTHWVESFSKIGTGGTQELDPLTAFVTLRKSDLGFGRLVVNVSNHTLAAPQLTLEPDCGPGCTQSYEWKGSVTFIKAKGRVGP